MLKLMKFGPKHFLAILIGSNYKLTEIIMGRFDCISKSSWLVSNFNGHSYKGHKILTRTFLSRIDGKQQ